ncbi:hypothetical protein [Peribacillus frigoritolerans]|uniref:hypothetical protein n=1 Tax=Peribacillus frigoritolerans TaxID=450367 RepID=UPI00215ACA77|nr:hypothetical protein [Peribacillus frigoritolerans]MCR8870680.1 hypothetical protein [Peribacillus frigoritolerans]MCY8935649.1 hypothetical protein [Peribacillus frigoritolerans]
MKIPKQLEDLILDDAVPQAFSNLTGAGIDKMFQQTDELKKLKYRELLAEEVFGYEKFGPQDIRELVSQYVYDMTNDIMEDSTELIEPFGNMIDQTFIYITGSMNEVANVMEQMGIDLPEGLDLLPGASELILGVRLLLDIKTVNNEFVGISTDKKVNIAAAKALVTMSKFGVTLTLTALGTAAGGAGGGMVGGVGAIVGAPLGALTGGVTAGYINKKIAPHAQEIAYKLLKLQKEDLFYYKNKVRIDEIGDRLLNYRRNIEALKFNQI